MEIDRQGAEASAGNDQRAESARDGLRLAVLLATDQTRPTTEQTDQVAAVSAGAEALPGQVVREHLEQVLLSGGEGVELSLQWLYDAGLLTAILPELAATVDFAQEMGRRHKDVWKHTKQVVAQSYPEVGLRWAALLHDIGKVPTREITPDGKVTFHGHAEVGARMFDRVSRRLGFPRPLRKRVRFLILHHLRANQYDGTWTDSAVRRFDRELGEHLDDLLLLSRADITSARQNKRDTAQRQIDELSERVLALREIDSRTPPLPSGLGDEIIARFDLAPGPIIGELRRELVQAVETGELEPHQAADYYLEFLARRSSRLTGG